MRLLPLRRRRPRNRLAHGLEQLAVRILAFTWIARRLLHLARSSGR